MTVDDLVKVIGSIEIGLCALFANIFCILYQILARWWETDVGRNIMGLAACIAIIINLWFIALLFGGDNDWFRLMRAAAFAGIPYILGRRIWLLLKFQVFEPRKEAKTRKLGRET